MISRLVPKCCMPSSQCARSRLPTLAPRLPARMQRWVAELGYKDLVTFTSTDSAGGTVYHTNVMMTIGTGAWAAGREVFGCGR